MLISYIAFFPFSLAGFLGLLDPFFEPRSSLELVPSGYNLSFFLFIATTYLWALPCVILWHRLYLLGPEHLLRRKIWPILTRSFVLISKVLFLVGVCVTVAALLVIMLTFTIEFLNIDDSISNFLELSDVEFIRYLSIVSITGLLTYLVFLRFTLAICARTIGKRMGLLASWRLTEKNTFRMFLSFAAIIVPTGLITFGVLYLYQSLIGINLFFSGEMLGTASYVHLFILAPVITLPLGSMCSQCASFYRHCGGENYIKT